MRLMRLLVRPLRAALAGRLANLAPRSQARSRRRRLPRAAGHRGCPRLQVLARQRIGRRCLPLYQARDDPLLSAARRTAISHARTLSRSRATLVCSASSSRRGSLPRARQTSRVRPRSDRSVGGPTPSPRPKESMERLGEPGELEWPVQRRARGHRDCSPILTPGTLRLNRLRVIRLLRLLRRRRRDCLRDCLRACLLLLLRQTLTRALRALRELRFLLLIHIVPPLLLLSLFTGIAPSPLYDIMSPSAQPSPISNIPSPSPFPDLLPSCLLAPRLVPHAPTVHSCTIRTASHRTAPYRTAPHCTHVKGNEDGNALDSSTLPPSVGLTLGIGLVWINVNELYSIENNVM